MLKLVHIKKDYIMGDTKVEALKGINLNFRKNEFVSILGPSGCGKTTLLNIIGGLDKYTDGDLVINGVSTKEFTDRDWDVYRNHRIGFIFQSYNLIPVLTAQENVEMALQLLNKFSKEEVQERSFKILEEVGLGGMQNRKPMQLSGGQQQRISIARALVKEPAVILADEPTANLDSKNSQMIIELMKKLNADHGITCIFSTHDKMVMENVRRIIRIRDGKIVAGEN